MRPSPERPAPPHGEGPRPETIERDDCGTLPLALSAEETARLLGVAPRTWRLLVASGRALRPIRLGRRVLWRRAELDAWLAAGAPPREHWETMRIARGGRP